MDNVYGIFVKIDISIIFKINYSCFFYSYFSSWESTLITTTNRLSPIELACCNRFVELCKQALFIVYRYSIDEKIKKQKQQQSEGSTIMVIS
jgi:tubulin polyglutamylase TTLL7